MNNSEQLVYAIKTNIDKLIKEEYIAAYIIGSTASDDYVPGRSDCDIVVVNDSGTSNEEVFIFNTEILSAKDTDFKPEQGDVKITVCYRSYNSVLKPIETILTYDSKQMVSGKELGVVEDSILIVGQGIFVAGKDIRENICLPDTKQFACYLKVVENLASEYIPESDVVELMQISKNIMLYAKHFYYMWTKKIIYSSRIVESIKLIPEFDFSDILKDGYEITRMSWMRCRIYLNRTPEVLSKYRHMHDVFMQKCVDVCWSRQIFCTLRGMRGRTIELYHKCYSGERILYEYNEAQKEIGGI